ncbi:6583_t:CDS:2 [Racocetra fulgida]|uniref:transketolase n=1 Tax=Racocetra fulgida TaxID=60492 RepID=A0A9N8Z0A3_9GLOM|nr:6583_t:CDS:2 [Racocetra fulgida]
MTNSLDILTINTIRTLAADVVRKANSGHPDRFVLSNGHACALQYILLHILGYDLTMDDLKQFRQTDSKTPGHPESHLTPGIEVSTGPLGQADGDNDLDGIAAAIEKAKKVTDKPSIIKVKTIIGIGSKHQGSEKVHGSPLAPDDIVEVKKKYGFNPEQFFHVPNEVYEYCKHFRERGAKAEAEWKQLLEKYCIEYPELGSEIKRRFSNKLPDNWTDHLPRYTPSDPPVATRKSSETVLNKIADVLPELFGGSADLTPSNLTRWKTAIEFQPESGGLGTYSGRYVRFGVREHGMAATLNGLASYGGIIPFGASFLNFISYGLGAVRLSALSCFRAIYIMTHDSIGLGEDGPTHQPIETAASLRALPNILFFRPADGNEVSGVYAAAIQNTERPSVIALSRQNVPNLEGSSVEKTLKGGYVLKEADGAQIILVGTGTEVSIAVDAANLLEKDCIKARVVSLPSFELFEEQSLEYRLSVFPDGIPVLSIEALSIFGWSKYAHANLGMRSFGSSGPYKELYKKYGFTPENTAAKAKEVKS